MGTDMTKGRPLPILLRFTIPLLLGNLFQQFYNMADTIIVGRYMGAGALAAVGSTGIIMFLITGFAQGLTSGFTILTAQRYGAGDTAGVKRSVSAGIFLSAVTTVVLTGFFLAVMDPLLRLMQTPEDIFQEAGRYIRIIAPVVASSVVIAIGYSLFTVGARSFGGGYAEDFGSASNLLLGAVTLTVCLGWNILARGYLKQLSVLAGLVVGYILAVFMGKVDLSVIFSEGIVSLPALLPFVPEFHMGAIFSVAIIFMVSAAETIGDTTAMVSGGLGREITSKEISGSLACDGFASVVSALFGCPPVTSFSQNVGLVNMTKVVNRFTIATGAGCMLLAGFLPPVGNFFASLPESVLGGCTIMMFGTIMVSGIQMLSRAGFIQRNMTIAALSLSVGIGFTAASEIDLWRIFPEVVQSVFSANVVAVVFVVSILLNLILPEDMELERIQG